MRIFLSYSTPDYDLAKRFADALSANRPATEIYFAPQRNKAAAYWMPILGEELKAAGAMLLLIGKRIGPWQELEYYEALRLWKQSGQPLILPIINADVVPGLHFLHHFHSLTLDRGMFATTVEGILAALEGASSTVQTAAWRVTNPYRGLNAMGTGDAAFFFGREELTASILDRICSNPRKILALVGNSGVGKSSVARAGVLGSLRSQLWPSDLDRAWPTGLADSSSWIAIEFVPGERPVQALARSLTDLWLDSPAESLKEALGWAELFEAGKAGLGDLAQDAARKVSERDGAPAPTRFVLYIDQGEELYSRALPAEAKLFSRLVADAAGRPEFIVVTSLRADWYGSLQADEALFPASERIDVPPLNRAQIDEVVRKPAARLGVRFDNPAVVPLIAEATAREPGSLPMLSFLMEDAWKAMQADELSGGALRFPFEIVDVSRPLAERAEKFFDKHPDSRDAIKKLFTLRLAQVPTDGKPVRRRARRGECGPVEWGLATELTTQEWRLLASGDDQDGPFVEVAHEKLLENWPRLSTWIDDERGFLASKGHLEIARREWEVSAEKDKGGALLMGLALDRARRWLADGRAGDLGPEDCAFIEASMKQDDAQKRAADRRRRIVFWGSVAASVVLAVVASVAGYQWFEAEGARFEAEDARKVAEDARILADKQRDRARQSYRTALDATDTFLTALTDNFTDSAALPADKIKTILSSGEAFLADMETRIGASSELQAVRAKMLTRFAGINAEDDIASARKQLEAARQALATLPPDDPATKLRQAGILILEAQLAMGEQNYQGALERAASAVKLISASPASTVDAKIVLADAYFAKSNAEWKLTHYPDAVQTADACLASFGDDARHRENSLQYRFTKCLHTKALSLSDGKIGDYVNQTNALYQSEIEALKGLIEREPTNVSFRVNIVKVMNNLSTFGEAEKNNEIKLSRLQEAREIARAAHAIAPWSTDAVDLLAHTSHWAADTMTKMGRRQEAYAAFAEAADLREWLFHKDPANVDWRNRYEETLSSLRINAVEIGKDGLKQNQVEYLIDAIEKHIGLLEKPTEQELKSDYAKWELLEARFRLAEALKWNNRISDSAAAYMTVIKQTDGAVGIDADEKRPRYFAAWSNWNYPKCDLFFNLEISLEDKIKQCRKAIALREAYLKKEDHWGVRQVVAQDRHILGKLLFAAGEREAALSEVEYAVSRDDEAAIKTLEGWYRNGDGPVAADSAKAAGFAKRLSTEYFGMKRFTFPAFAWDRTTKVPQYIYIRNPKEFSPDPVAEEIHRIEAIEGFDIPDDVEASFHKLLKIANDNKVSFTDLTVYALGNAGGNSVPADQNELQKTVFGALRAKDFKRLLRDTAPFLKDDRGRGALDAVLAALAKKPEKDPITNPEGIHYLAVNWWGILDAGGYELAERAASALMKETATLEDRTVWLYRRGLARDGGGDFAGAISDLTTVAASFPGYITGLNSLAYTYLESGTEPDRALEIAKRANKLAPDDIFIKDTLGFAQIKSNNLDAGIKTLNEVVAADDKLADPWAHLAEGYRLAGRFGEARTAIGRARQNAKAPRLIKYIDEQEKLNNDNEQAATNSK